MRSSKMRILMMVLALAAASALPAAARGPKGGGGARDCISVQVAPELSADGQSLRIAVRFVNGCAPDLDLDGVVRLLVDGQEVDAALLGPDDSARLEAILQRSGDDELAPQAREIAVRFDGTATAKVKGKLQESPYHYQRAVTLLF